MENNHNEHYQSLEKEIKQLYNDNVQRFVGRFREYGLDDCLDAYHEAVQVVFRLLKDGRRTKVEGEIRDTNGLLLKIGKHKLIDILKKRNREQSRIAALKKEVTPDDLMTNINLFHSNEKLDKLRAGFRKLGKKCQQIISLNYYEGYDLDEIAGIMSYSSYDVAKQRLYVCMENLRKIVFGSE